MRISIKISVPWALTLIFLVLKLADVVKWSWWWIFSPLWIIALAAVAVAVIGIVVVLGSALVAEWRGDDD